MTFYISKLKTYIVQSIKYALKEGLCSIIILSRFKIDTDEGIGDDFNHSAHVSTFFQI